MLSSLYAKWMIAWETALTTRDTNRIVRPLEWGFDWLECHPTPDVSSRPEQRTSSSSVAQWRDPRTPLEPSSIPEAPTDLDRMIALNHAILAGASDFFSYATPTDFRLETRHPELFPTNVRPETLAHDARIREQAHAGELATAEFLRFTSPVTTPFSENDTVNARWYPAHRHDQQGLPKQAIIVMPQWNADAFSHNALCSLFNRFGVSALRLSKPFHDIRRPAELERSDYAVSTNIGRTIAACRQAVADIRSCIDWLETQGYTQFGVLGTSLGSSYAFIAAVMDPRLEVCVFNHASSSFGDVLWSGQSTRHLRAAFEEAGLTQDDVREVFTAISPASHVARFAANSPRRRSLVVYATHDLTFPLEGSLEAIRGLQQYNANFTARVLPCGHYTTGEFPFKYLDGWYLGSFVYHAFKQLRAGN